MAIQTGPVFLRGRYGNICAYWCSGQWRFRQVSSLTGKRVKTSRRFVNTMVYAEVLKRASRIASQVYAGLPAHWKQFWMYRLFVGEAMGMLKEGKADKEALQVLWERYAAEFAAGYEEEAAFVHTDVNYIIKNKRRPVPHAPIPGLQKSIWRIYPEMPKQLLLQRIRHRKKRAISRDYEELLE